MNRPIRIFAFPTHCTKTVTTGVDFVRIIQPMKELAKDPRFEVELFDQKSTKVMDWKEWERIAQYYDILYLNYITLAGEYSLIGMLFEKYKKKIVMDLDDLIWEIQSDNSSYATYAPGSEGRAVVTDICRHADYMTCTNNFLKNGIAAFTQKPHERIEVLPNYIDLDLYHWHEEPPEKHTIRIGYFGSSSHFNDLANKSFTDGLEKLMSEYPQVEFMTIGAMLGSIKKKFGQRYITDYGHQDIYTWIKMFPEKLGNIDIFVSPLVDTTYNRAKSSIKFLEMSSTGRPGVWQNIRQYGEIVQDGRNGFLASTSDEWYSRLKRLVESPELRSKLGAEALRTVEKKWTIQGNISKYSDFFMKVMKNSS